MTKREELLEYLDPSRDEPFPKIGSFSSTMPGYCQCIDVPVCERTLYTAGYDVYGVHWSVGEPTSHATPNMPEIISDIEDWESQLKIPKIDKFDWDYLYHRESMFDRKNKLIYLTMCIGPFERSTMLSTFENDLVNAITYPEEFSAMIGALADFKVAMLKEIIPRSKPDIVNFQDDWGSNIGPIISPQLWRETIKPHIQKIYDILLENNIIVCQHSCGNLGEIADDLPAMGVTAHEAQSSCNDVEAMRKKFKGKMCLMWSDNSRIDTFSNMEQNKPDELEFPERTFWAYDQVPTFLYE